MRGVLYFLFIILFCLFARAADEWGSIASVVIRYPPDTMLIQTEPACIPTGSGNPDLDPKILINYTDATQNSITIIAIGIDILQNAGIQLIKIYRDDDLLGYADCYGIRSCTFIKNIFEWNRKTHNYYAKAYDNRCHEVKSEIIEISGPGGKAASPKEGNEESNAVEPASNLNTISGVTTLVQEEENFIERIVNKIRDSGKKRDTSHIKPWAEESRSEVNGKESGEMPLSIIKQEKSNMLIGILTVSTIILGAAVILMGIKIRTLK